jgi:NADH-quinone oxidoreductase subunit J
VGLLLYGVLAASLVISNPKEQADAQTPREQMADSTLLGQALLGTWQASPTGTTTGFPAGAQLRRRLAVSYLLPFEIVSVHLLVVLIGAAYLARAKRRRLPATSAHEQQLGARA